MSESKVKRLETIDSHAKKANRLQGLVKGKPDLDRENKKLKYHEVEKWLLEEIVSNNIFQAKEKGNGSTLSSNKAKNFLPKIEQSGGEIVIKFPVPKYTADTVHGVLKIAKNYHANIRIKNWNQEDFRFQVMNDNVFNTTHLDDNLFFSVQGVFGIYNFYAKRKGYLSSNDLNFILHVYKFIHRAINSVKPEELLEQLGVMVYKDDDSFNWESLAGYDRVKREVMESVILPLKHPDVYEEVNILTRNGVGSGKERGRNRPRGILFAGPPGVGKTTMARMIAQEVKVPLLYIPIESIISKYYGESSKNLSQIFEIASRLEGAILFLDEIDSLAGSRDSQMFEATRRVLSVLLRYVDGFETKKNVLTIGATNRRNDLDAALLSRFDHTVQFDLPDEQEKVEIIKKYARQLSHSDIEKLAKNTQSYSGRNLKDLCDYAERWWARHIILQKLEISAPSLEAYIKALEIRNSI